MFIDGNKVEGRVTADICIVGGGMVGLHLAATLLDSGLTVAVLEAGDLAYSKEAQALHEFETTDLPVNRESRIIRYGGTSTVWGGLLRPLDPIDFTERPWVPNSGWPFSFDDLKPYFDKAAAFLDVPRLSDFALPLPSTNTYIPKSYFEPAVFYFMKKEYLDFGKRFKKVFEESKNINIYTNSNVVGLVEEGGTVNTVKIKTPQGGAYAIFAGRVVLAAGGIENARLLLLSNIGSAHDQVGRYYMDHPKGRLGVMHFAKPVDLSSHWGIDTPRGKGVVGFKLQEQVQTERKVLNSYVQAAYRLDVVYRLMSKISGRKLPVKEVTLNNFLEQAPVASNRVSLSSTADALGSPRATLSWSLSPQDTETIVAIHRMLKEDLSTSGNELESNAETLEEWPFKEAAHHMGTTRMGKDIAKSVTDSNAKVHGIDNLYIAGTSLFPTSGCANPMYTVFALTHKLSEHLKHGA